MLNLRDIGRDDLNLVRVRVAGWRSGRKGLLRQLDRVPLASLALGTDEILYVPRLHVRQIASERLADAAFEALKGMAAAAEQDPSPGRCGSFACRFSSRARYLAWLLGLWLGGGSQKALAIAATGASSLRECQRREVMRDGPMLVAVTAHLVEARLAVEWMARFEPYDHELAEASLAQSFAIDLRTTASKPPASQPPHAKAAAVLRPFRRQARLNPPMAERSIIDAGTEVAALCRELDQAGDDWRRLPSRGRLLLLTLISFGRAPARASASSYMSALAAAAAVTTDFVTARGEAPKLPAESPTRAKRPIEQRMSKIAPEPRRQGSTLPRFAVADPSPVRTAPPTHLQSRVDDERGSLKTTPTQPVRRSPRPDAAEVAVDEAGLAFRSDFAGLLFLLNAFVALGLYPDFTGGERPKLRPSPLWLIDRVGNSWFGRRYRRDPLHRWIAANSRGGQLPRDWRVEEVWRNAWKARERVIRLERAGRLTLWHPAGFPITDIPAHGREGVDLKRATRLRTCLRSGRRASHVPRLPIGRPQRWITCLALFLDARIRLATGHRAMGLSALALPGDLIVDELDISASFSLDRHPLPLRVAGLDRNPAWQPAEGRSFRFHFS